MEEEQIKVFADSLWDYILEKKLKQYLSDSVCYYMALVVEPASNGYITVQRPFDNAVTLPCAANAEGMNVGETCAVLVFGDFSNQLVIGNVAELGGNFKITETTQTTLTGALYGNGSTVEAKPSMPTLAITKAAYDALPASEKAKDIIYNIIDDETAAIFQPIITANGVLIGNGGGGISAKTLDTSTLTNDNNHIPTSGVVKSALTGVGSAGVLLTASDDLNNVWKCGFYWWTNSPANAPINYALMTVTSRVDSVFTQEVTATDATNRNRTWRRTCYSGTFGDWEELAKKSDLDNYQEIDTVAYMTSGDISAIESAFKSAGQYTFISIAVSPNQGACVMGQKRTNTLLFKGFFTAGRGANCYVGIATRTPDANGDGTWTFVNFI